MINNSDSLIQDIHGTSLKEGAPDSTELPPESAVKNQDTVSEDLANTNMEINGTNGYRPDSAGNVPIVEAVLLLEGHPATPARIARVTGLKVDEIQRCLDELRARYASGQHGLQITRVSDSYSIMPKAELWQQLRPHYGNDSGKQLSRAALETLTIVAYSQPVTRSQVEAMRGVSPDAMIRLLTDRQLIRPIGYKEDAIGRPTLFGTTNRFLESFGLETINDLPKLDKVEEDRFQRN